MGEYLGEKLRALRDEASLDRRGARAWAVLGCRSGEEPETKQPFNTMQDKLAGKPLVVDQVAAEMMKNGVAMQAWMSHFVLAPPLIIEKQDIDFGVSVLDRALSIADQAAKP